jgi:hypothetical protein
MGLRILCSESEALQVEEDFSFFRIDEVTHVEHHGD